MTETSDAPALDLAALRRAAEAATPGPWAVIERGNSVKSLSVKAAYETIHICGGLSPKTGDAAYIAAANPATLLALLDRLAATERELDAVRYAAHMPDDYQYGLPSWINQHLYGKLIMLLDSDGRVIRRTEDIEEMHSLRQQLAAAEARERALRVSCQELVDAMVAYQMDVDESPPYKHRQMMQRAAAALADAGGEGGG